MIIHVRLKVGIPRGGELEKERIEAVEAVVEVAVVSVAGATESVASEVGGEAATGDAPGGETPGGRTTDAEEETTDPCCWGPKSRKVVTLVPTRRRRKWASTSLIVMFASRYFERER